MSRSERIAALDKATTSAPLNIEASFRPPNVSFKDDLRPLCNDILKEIIDAARKAPADAFGPTERAPPDTGKHLFDAKEARAKWKRYPGAKLLVVKSAGEGGQRTLGRLHRGALHNTVLSIAPAPNVQTKRNCEAVRLISATFVSVITSWGSSVMSVLAPDCEK
jgi:hypothetical protein